MIGSNGITTRYTYDASGMHDVTKGPLQNSTAGRLPAARGYGRLSGDRRLSFEAAPNGP